MAKKPKKPTTTVRLEVTDINEHSNTVLLEGFAGDLKYILMIDADLDQKMVMEAVVGDKWDVSLKNAIKLTAKKNPKTGAIVTGQVKGSPCTGSGASVSNKDVFIAKGNSRYLQGGGKIQKTKCPDCGKEIAINGGYGGRPMTVRKHNV